MNKPTGFDEAQVMGDWTPPELGGHYLIIKDVREQQTATGKPMIVVFFDFNKNDKQPGYFMTQFTENTDPDKKWPIGGRNYIMVNDYMDDSKTSKSFKTFCTCVENSNKGFKVTWGGDNWGQQFRNKLIGGIFGQVENEYNGKITMRSQLRWFCSVDKVADAKIPNPKYLNGSSPSTSQSTASSSNDPYDFVNVDENNDDGVPF